MTSQQFIAALDSFIQAFWMFARGTLAPISVLAGFCLACKFVAVLSPWLGSFIPGFFTRPSDMVAAMTCIGCALAGRA